MQRNSVRRGIGIILIGTSMQGSALELGDFQPLYTNRELGHIIVHLEPAEQDLNILIKGVEDYVLEPNPRGANIILLRTGNSIERVSVIAKYGEKETHRDYSIDVSRTTRNQTIVQKGETISDIAQALQAITGGTLKQRMQALIQANPDAFIEGDHNQIKEGFVLLLPDAQTVKATQNTPIQGEPLSKPHPRVKAAVQKQATHSTVPPVASDPIMASLDRSIAQIQKLLSQLNHAPKNQTPSIASHEVRE